MKIKVRKTFKYTFDNVKNYTLTPGEYNVPGDIDKDAAELALAFRCAEIVEEPKPEKKAPENKAVAVPENKATKAKKKAKGKK